MQARCYHGTHKCYLRLGPRDNEIEHLWRRRRLGSTGPAYAVTRLFTESGVPK